MATKLFVNLPVKDLDRSVTFFKGLGYTFNPNFTDENATCMVLGEDNFVMLLVEKFFQTFTHQPIADARQVTEVIVCVSADSREAVDDLVARAVKGGATLPWPPKDHGFMYQHGYQDLDGHLWEVVWMDPAAAPPSA